jgi:PTH1 family peptidyl-tRNA hydrolase
MRMIIGLGNPGKEYADTRHNIGFMVLRELARRHNPPTAKSRFRAEVSEFFIDAEKVIMVAPQTFMNASGVAAQQAVNWYHIDVDDVLIVSDDLDLPFGQLRFRANGSAGGHNGIKSIIEQLGTSEIPRLKVGIGRGPGTATAHVLSRFSAEDAAELPDLVSRAADVVELWIRHGLLTAMNSANQRPAPESSPVEKKA